MLSLFEARNTVSPTEFVGLRNYRDMLTDPAFRSSLLTFVAFAAFIVPLTFACSLALALLVNRAARGEDVVPLRVLPSGRVQLRGRLADLEGVDLQRRALRPRQHGAAGVRVRGTAVVVATRPAAVLGGDRQRAAVAAGRLLHVAVPRRPATHPGGALRGGRGRRGVAGLADVPLHHLAAAASDVGGGASCCC